MDRDHSGKMNTPICDFVRDYNVPGKIRMHMPGHKGRGTGRLSEALDITEIHGADALYEASGIIRELFYLLRKAASWALASSTIFCMPAASSLDSSSGRAVSTSTAPVHRLRA